MEKSIRISLLSQHLAALQMMEDVVEEISDDLWLSDDQVNPTWQIVYHSLFFYRLYLHQSLQDFQHWEGHRKGAQNLVLDPDYSRPTPYSRDEMKGFIEDCRRFTKQQLAILDINSTESGFEWYQVPKVEHLIVNVRHLQHHVGQLQDRLRNTESKGISWTRSV